MGRRGTHTSLTVERRTKISSAKGTPGQNQMMRLGSDITQGQRAEARYGGAALSRGIRIVAHIVVQEIVSRKHSPAWTAAVETKTGFMVPQGLSLGSCGESRNAGIRSGNVFEKVF